MCIACDRRNMDVRWIDAPLTIKHIPECIERGHHTHEQHEETETVGEEDVEELEGETNKQVHSMSMCTGALRCAMHVFPLYVAPCCVVRVARTTMTSTMNTVNPRINALFSLAKKMDTMMSNTHRIPAAISDARMLNAQNTITPPPATTHKHKG